MTGQSTPPGFYPDPENPGQQRYWDGTSWSATTSAGSPGAPQPQVGYGYAAGAPGTTLDNGTPVKIAEPLMRFLARVIDWIIVGIPFGIVYTVIIAGMATADFNPNTGQFEGGASFIVIQLLSGLLIAALYIAYDTFMVSSRGATIGKQLLGLKVVNQADGSNLEMGQALTRSGFLFGPQIVPCIGPLVALAVAISLFFDNSGRRQGWQDKQVKSLVIATK